MIYNCYYIFFEIKYSPRLNIIRDHILSEITYSPISEKCNKSLPFFSAGTGRTGAFIGIMNSLDRLIHKEDLDTLGLVGSLRQQRRKMVFTNVSF